MTSPNTTALIKPFTATVNSQGQAIAVISHSLHGLAWEVMQIGFALGISAPSPQVAAHVNGVPLAAAVTMQPSVFAAMMGQAPYAMESYFVGPPYTLLEAGDQIVCAVLGAIMGDIFTAGAYVNEITSPASQAAAANNPSAGQIRRAGQGRWVFRAGA